MTNVGTAKVIVASSGISKTESTALLAKAGF